MEINSFLNRIKRGDRVTFAETQSLISEHYRYTPTRFSNGLDNNVIVNAAGVNEGSCKIFAFAMINELSKELTLSLFGDYYWIDVLENPDKITHLNIRNFIQYGWNGIKFSGKTLTPLKPE